MIAAAAPSRLEPPDAPPPAQTTSRSRTTAAVTVGGVLFTQHQARRRDDLNWSRERERERERWAREDADRTFTDRREAYVGFYESLKDMALLIYSFGMGLSEKPDESEKGRLPSDFQLPTFRRLQNLRLYATPQTARRADEAYSAAWQWGHRARFSQDEEQFYEDQNEFDTCEESLLEAIRTDLGIPDKSVVWQYGLIDARGTVLDDVTEQLLKDESDNPISARTQNNASTRPNGT
jgi:hypothetical protein